MGAGPIITKINPTEETFKNIYDEKKEMSYDTYIPGSTFNKMTSGVKFVKLTNYNEKHRAITYSDGLNKDLNFGGTGFRDTVHYGIYFTTYNNIYKWITYNKEAMYWYREVTVPDDAKVRIGKNNSYNVNKIILGRRRCIWSNPNLCTVIVLRVPSAIRFVIPTLNKYGELCLSAVTVNSNIFLYIDTDMIKQEILEKIYEIVVEYNGMFIYLIKNPTPQLQLSAVKNIPLAINYIKKEDRTTEMRNLLSDYLIKIEIKNKYEKHIEFSKKYSITINGINQNRRGILYLENQIRNLYDG